VSVTLPASEDVTAVTNLLFQYPIIFWTAALIETLTHRGFLGCALTNARIAVATFEACDIVRPKNDEVSEQQFFGPIATKAANCRWRRNGWGAGDAP
jgi:hypothetical protein